MKFRTKVMLGWGKDGEEEEDDKEAEQKEKQREINTERKRQNKHRYCYDFVCYLILYPHRTTVISPMPKDAFFLEIMR